MGTNCALLVADLFLFCYERDFILHRNSTVARRVTTVRTERGVRLTVCQGDVS